MIEAIEIPLPPLDEQRRIAAILDKAEALRRKRRQALDLLNGLTQSIFLETIAASEPKEVVLEELCEKITDGTHQAPAWAKQGIPFLFVSNVRRQKISFATEKHVSEQEYARLTKHSPIEPGDVLYTAVGSYGHTAVVPNGPRFVFQRHIAHLKPRRDAILPDFLALALESSGAKAQADRLARGVAQKTVTLGALKNLSLPVPSLQRQAEFVSVLQTIRENADCMEQALEYSEGLFASLQSRAFSS